MRVLYAALMFVLSSQVYASPDQAMALFNDIMQSEVRRAEAVEEGLERTRFCGHCHGQDGNSKREHIPNLAGQHPLYLFNAFEKFAKGERVDFVMSQLAKNLTLQDRVNVAVYYSTQTVKTPAQKDAPNAQGAQLFAGTCAGCHGGQGQGFETLPRLAGQPKAYVVKALTRFKTHDPARQGSIMQAIAEKLSEQEIEALAGYVSALETH